MILPHNCLLFCLQDEKHSKLSKLWILLQALAGGPPLRVSEKGLEFELGKGAEGTKFFRLSTPWNTVIVQRCLKSAES